MPSLSPYELEIQENIRKNRELLQSLGIFRPDITGKGKEKKPPVKKNKEGEEAKRKSSEDEDENVNPKADKKHLRASKRRKRFNVNYDNYDEDNDYSSSDSDSYASNTPDKPTSSRRSTRLKNINISNAAGSSQGQRRKSKRVAEAQSSDPIDLLAESDPISTARSKPTMPKLRLEDRKHRLSLPDTSILLNSSFNSSLISRKARSLADVHEEPSPIKLGRRKRAKFASEPQRDEDGNLVFPDAPSFRPNLTPKEMLEMGSFGGTAFRRHFSSVTQAQLPTTDYTELPFTWYSQLHISTYLTSSVRNPEINRYKVNAGQTLEEWEASGWIRECDPRGWFQWYCRFYMGRRLDGGDGEESEDQRQIRRWMNLCGPKGRFRTQLIKKIAVSGGEVDDESISPVSRQTLQHWGYRLTRKDYNKYFSTT